VHSCRHRREEEVAVPCSSAPVRCQVHRRPLRDVARPDDTDETSMRYPSVRVWPHRNVRRIARELALLPRIGAWLGVQPSLGSDFFQAAPKLDGPPFRALAGDALREINVRYIKKASNRSLIAGFALRETRENFCDTRSTSSRLLTLL
jgi:hypothetical protein